MDSEGVELFTQHANALEAHFDNNLKVINSMQDIKILMEYNFMG